MKAIILLSGGLDSATAGAIAKSEGYELYAISFIYGQRHSKEIESAKKVAKWLEVKEHKIVNIDLTLWGGSALTDSSIPVPVIQKPLENGKTRKRENEKLEIPITYVPARNTIMLSFALGYAEVIGADVIFAGMNYIDYSGYPDCRPEYIAKFNELAKLATKAGVENNRSITVLAPLLYMSKAEIIKKGIELGLDYSITWSCYQGGEKACGVCDSCRLRLKGFEDNAMKDPIEYY